MMNKVFKTIIALVLCCTLLVGFAALTVARETPLRITVTTDTHYKSFKDAEPFPSAPAPEDVEGMLDAEVFYYATMQGQMNYESPAIMNSFLDAFVNGEDDYLLIAGDLTGGKRQSHLELSEKLRNAEKLSGKEIFVVPGNHDCEKEKSEDRIDINEFKEIYADFGYNQALNAHAESGSYTYDLSDEYRLLAIDSCIYGEDDGEINASVFAWIEEQARAAEKDGVRLIAMMHHSVLPHFYVQPMMKNYSAVAERFARLGITVVLTGHIHANDISLARTSLGSTIYDIQTGSLITSPNAYRHITLGESIEVTTDYVTKIDTGDLPEGYSEEQLRRIDTDFPKYSADFFEAGMYAWIRRYLGSAEKVGKLLKLDRDGVAYRELDGIMKAVARSINLPIYDDGSTPGVPDSFEELAELFGYAIPESDYERIYQVIAAVMGNFYRGDGTEMHADGEVQLLIACIKTAVLYFADSTVLRGQLSKQLMRTEIPSYTPIAATADKLTAAVVLPLLQGLSSDYSSPDDLNAVLEFDADKLSLSERAPKGFFEAFLRFFVELFASFRRLFGVRPIIK